jgi:hypothetical protein
MHHELVESVECRRAREIALEELRGGVGAVKSVGHLGSLLVRDRMYFLLQLR